MVNNLTYCFRQAGFVVSLFCFFVIVSCENDNPIIASVDYNELSKSDASLMMRHLGYNIKSQKEWSKFIDYWCEQQVLKEELKSMNSAKARLVEMRSQFFIGELSKYYVEEERINEKLDTSVTESELLKFYELNKETFDLQDYIVKALYVKVPKEAKNIEKIKKSFLLKNDKDLAQVNSYAKLYADYFYFNDEEWIYFNELTKDIPLRNYNIDNIVLNRTKTYFSDNNYYYFLNIIDYNLKNATPPIEFLKPQIREMIVARRMNNYREKNESKLIQEIKKKYEIKIHL